MYDLVQMRVALIEAWYSGSHRAWADGLIAHSNHDIQLYSLKGRYWKWRMYGGAISLAKKLLDDEANADVIIVSSLLDVGVFISLIRHRYPSTPVAVYFHENQLTYPWSPTDTDQQDRRDRHYMFTNYTSALTADAVWFNSQYHKESFLAALPKFLKPFPDHRNGWTVEAIASKSSVLHLGLYLKDLRATDRHQNTVPLIVWPHRWEHDKGPGELLQLLRLLKERRFEFELALTGQSTGNTPDVFATIHTECERQIIQWGFLESKEAYHALLLRSDFIVSTASHDFFGAAVAEGIAAGCYPILPDALAYPEHIPQQLQKFCLYTSIEQAADLVIKANDTLDLQTTRNHVLQYDWSTLIRAYDDTIERLLTSACL